MNVKINGAVAREQQRHQWALEARAKAQAEALKRS